MKSLNLSAMQEESLARYFEEIARTPLLTFEEELELSRKVENGDKTAQARLIQANLRLVIKIAKAYVQYGASFMDLIQEGNLGLIKAAGKFDYHKNVRFSTYASWWIKQSIVRALVNKNRLIRLPHRKEETLRKMMSKISEATAGQKPLSMDTLAAEMHLDKSEVLSLLEFSGTVASLDKEVGEDSASLLDLMEDPHYRPETEVMEHCFLADTQKLLNSLQSRERAIILDRFAFNGGKKATLKTIGDKMGISAESVRQLELRALNKLKVQKEHLRDYLYN